MAAWAAGYDGRVGKYGDHTGVSSPGVGLRCGGITICEIGVACTFQRGVWSVLRDNRAGLAGLVGWDLLYWYIHYFQ